MFAFTQEDVKQPLFVYQPVLTFVLEGTDEASSCTVTVRAAGIIVHHDAIEDRSDEDLASFLRASCNANNLNNPPQRELDPVHEAPFQERAAVDSCKSPLQPPPKPIGLERARTDPTPRRPGEGGAALQTSAPVAGVPGEQTLASAGYDDGLHPRRLDAARLPPGSVGVGGSNSSLLQQPPLGTSAPLFGEVAADKVRGDGRECDPEVALRPQGAGSPTGTPSLSPSLWGPQGRIWGPPGQALPAGAASVGGGGPGDTAASLLGASSGAKWSGPWSQPGPWQDSAATTAAAAAATLTTPWTTMQVSQQEEQHGWHPMFWGAPQAGLGAGGSPSVDLGEGDGFTGFGVLTASGAADDAS